MYKIHVENIRTKSYHGCLKEEGIIGGEYRTDVWVKLKDSYRVSKDELEVAMEVFTTSIQLAHHDIDI